LDLALPGLAAMPEPHGVGKARHRGLMALIRQMNRANPLWSASHIHSELLKLGIEVSQATVAKYMVRRIGTPSPTWRSFLRNEANGIAAIDMFVALSTSFRLLYVTVILAHGRRKDCAVRCYAASNGSVTFAAGNSGVSVGHSSQLSAARPRRFVQFSLPQAGCGDGPH
jgi:hypothetical protein